MTRDHFPRWPALDGVRAIAVLLVISWHVSGDQFGWLHGSNGVTVFFVLSGFLITALCLRDEGRGRFTYGSFVIKRAFRILPLLYLGIAVYAIMVFVLRLDSRARAYADAIPWILGYLPEVPVLGVGATTHGTQGPVPFAAVWSLGIEEKFYLVWPAVGFVALSRSRHRAILACGLCMALWAFTLFGPPSVTRFVSHYAPLLLGCAAACAINTPTGLRIMRWLTCPTIALFAVVGATALTLIHADAYGFIALQILIVLIISNVVLRPHSIPALILSTRPLGFVGLVSYPLYLFHSLALKVAEIVVPGDFNGVGWIHLILGLAIALPVCWVLHLMVEKPTQAWGRRVASRCTRTRSAVTRGEQAAPQLAVTPTSAC